MRCLMTAAVLVAGSAQADVVRLEVSEQHDWAGAQAFGADPYEYVTGTAWYEIDPASPAARDIADIKLAPRNARGRVKYHGPFLIIRHKEAARANGAAIVEVPNRGGGQTNRTGEAVALHLSNYPLRRPRLGTDRCSRHAPAPATPMRTG